MRARPRAAAKWVFPPLVRQGVGSGSRKSTKNLKPGPSESTITLTGVIGLHFPDLRHEGVSRMAEKGLNIGELAEQSGHRMA
jgi:integrase